MKNATFVGFLFWASGLMVLGVTSTLHCKFLHERNEDRKNQIEAWRKIEKASTELAEHSANLEKQMRCALDAMEIAKSVTREYMNNFDLKNKKPVSALTPIAEAEIRKNQNFWYQLLLEAAISVASEGDGAAGGTTQSELPKSF